MDNDINKKVEAIESVGGQPTPNDISAIKANAIGPDPMGDGDICSCGGTIVWRTEGGGQGGASRSGRCTRCGLTY